MTTAAATDETTRDLERFRESIRRGAPGPYHYVILLGLDTFDLPRLLRSVRRGFSFRAFERFVQNAALPVDRVMTFVDIPRRTLTRRKREGRLNPEESDRLLRASRVLGKTLALFEGDREAATEWLTSPQPGLGGAVPLELARTDLGARETEALLERLEHGVFS